MSHVNHGHPNSRVEYVLTKGTSGPRKLTLLDVDVQIHTCYIISICYVPYSISNIMINSDRIVRISRYILGNFTRVPINNLVAPD